MIDTYDLEKKQHELLLRIQYKTAKPEELLDAYIEASTANAEYKKTLEALQESLNSCLDGIASGKVLQEASKLIKEYDTRYLTPEDQKVLSEYGYTHPIALLHSLEEANLFMDNHYTVYLLNPDGTEKAAEMGIDVERHLQNGGLIGVTPFARMDMDMKWMYEQMGLEELLGEKEDE